MRKGGDRPEIRVRSDRRGKRLCGDPDRTAARIRGNSRQDAQREGIEEYTCLLLCYQTWDLSHTLSTQKEAVRPHPHRCTTEGCFEEGLEDRAWTDGKRQDKPEEKGYQGMIQPLMRTNLKLYLPTILCPNRSACS